MEEEQLKQVKEAVESAEAAGEANVAVEPSPVKGKAASSQKEAVGFEGKDGEEEEEEEEEEAPKEEAPPVLKREQSADVGESKADAGFEGKFEDEQGGAATPAKAKREDEAVTPAAATAGKPKGTVFEGKEADAKATAMADSPAPLEKKPLGIPTPSPRKFPNKVNFGADTAGGEGWL